MLATTLTVRVVISAAAALASVALISRGVVPCIMSEDLRASEA